MEMVGDDVGWCFQSPVYISIYRRWGCAKCKNSKNIWKKKSEKIKDGWWWCLVFIYHQALHSGSISGSAYTPKRKSQLIWPKSEEKQDANGFTYQGSSDGLSGGWSHDQLPKIKNKKTEVVALHYTFQNQLELCSKVLPLWRYNIKHFQKCCIFFFFFFFAFLSIKTTPHYMISPHFES